MRLATIAYLLTALAYVALRTFVFSAAGNVEFIDSESFIEKADSPLTFAFFFDEGRFFPVPLLYKITFALFGGTRTTLTTMQFVISLGSWLTSAWVFARMLVPVRLGFVGFVAALVLSLSTDVLAWDRTILSESLSTSSFVLMIAAWMRMGEGVTPRRSAALLASSLLFGLTREANALLLLPFAVVLVAWALWYLRGSRPQQWRCLGIAATWVVLFVVSTAVSQHGERWLFPLLNIIGQRVLTTPDRLAFWERAGMPITPRLLAMKGEFGGGQDLAFYKDPELETFRHWIRANGRAVFTRDLTANLGRTLAEPMVSLEEMMCPYLVAYHPPGQRTVLPELGQSRLCSPFWARASLYGSLGVGGAMLGLAGLLRRRLSPAAGARLLTGAAMLLGWPPFLWFTWQVIGGMEISRHALAGTFQFRLAVLLLAGHVLLAVGQRRRGPDLRPAAPIEGLQAA